MRNGADSDPRSYRALHPGPTLVTQLFFTGRIIRWVGLAGALAILPAMSVIGFGALGALASFQALAVFTVLRRATNFAIMNPAMEVLFTVVRREDRVQGQERHRDLHLSRRRSSGRVG